MRFQEWKMLVRENLSINKLKFLGGEVKNRIENGNHDFKKLFMVPDFDTFEREGQPVQQSVLFTDKKIRTFSFNYVESGDLYSVDFWKPTAKKPSVTMIINKFDIDDICDIVPKIARNPVLNPVLDRKNSLAESFSSGSDVRIENSKPQIEVKKTEHSAEEYEISDPGTIFNDLKIYVKMVIDGTQPSLVITGSSGVGKTYLVLKQLKDSGLENRIDYIHVKGRSTAAGMFITLYENNGKIVVFDDCDSVFSTQDAVNILKGALDSYSEREISWLVGKPLKTSTGENVPKSFVFTGKVIFISNLSQAKISDALKTRGFMIEIALSPDDMLKKMRHDLPNVLPDTPRYLREAAMSFLEKIASKNDDLELNMRTLIKAIKIVEEVDDLVVAERLIIQQCSYK